MAVLIFGWTKTETAPERQGGHLQNGVQRGGEKSRERGTMEDIARTADPQRVRAELGSPRLICYNPH